jgi:hypothetical protein
MKKIVIIGGGITGCVSALYCSELGYQVEIFEKKNSLGGIVSDIIEKKNFFFNGPQYYDVNSWWLKKLKKDKDFKNLFYNFYLKYGSFNDLFNKDVSSKNFAQIQTDLNFENVDLRKFKSYKERISCYQKNIYLPIENWSKRYCKSYEILHSNCSLLINTGRVFFSKDKNKIVNLKKNNEIIDDLLGVPRKNYQSEKFCIPILGNKFFFDRVKNYLEKRKIKVHLDSTIKPTYEKEKISLFNKDNRINFDYSIWCANPVPLIKSSNFGTLDNPVVNVLVLAMNVDVKENLSENLYLQVFSNTKQLFRIFIYKIKKQTKLSLELIFNKHINRNDEIDFAIKILKKHKIFIKNRGHLSEIKEVRHMLFSINDYKKFEDYEKSKFSKKTLSGGWQLVGREKKINYIINNINKYIKN